MSMRMHGMNVYTCMSTRMHGMNVWVGTRTGRCVRWDTRPCCKLHRTRRSRADPKYSLYMGDGHCLNSVLRLVVLIVWCARSGKFFARIIAIQFNVAGYDQKRNAVLNAHLNGAHSICLLGARLWSQWNSIVSSVWSQCIHSKILMDSELESRSANVVGVLR